MSCPVALKFLYVHGSEHCLVQDVFALLETVNITLYACSPLHLALTTLS